MIRNAGYAMEQFCASCRAKGHAIADCWWPYSREFFGYQRASANRVATLKTQCRVCELERINEWKTRKAA